MGFLHIHQDTTLDHNKGFIAVKVGKYFAGIATIRTRSGHLLVRPIHGVGGIDAMRKMASVWESISLYWWASTATDLQLYGALLEKAEFDALTKKYKDSRLMAKSRVVAKAAKFAQDELNARQSIQESKKPSKQRQRA